MGALFYSTGQVARQLGTTLATIRLLCDNHVIASETTPGGHWRVPASEVERLKRDGLPPVPRPLPTESAPPVRNGKARPRGHPELLAEPSDDLINSAEETVRLANEVKSLELRRQKEEQLDWFRQRENRDAERAAQQQEAEQRRRAQLAAEQRRQAWKTAWLEYGVNAVPCEAPQSVRLDVHEAVIQALERLDPSHPNSITQPLVDAAIDRALTPWHTAKQVADTIKDACDSYNVPWEMRQDSTWRARMYQAAGAAVGRLRYGAGIDEVKTAASHAIVPLVRQFEHERSCGQMVRDVWMKLSLEAPETREQGRDAVKAALEQLPLGAPKREMERARENALEPVNSTIAARQDREMRDGLLQWFGLRYEVMQLSREAQQKALDEIKGAFNQLSIGTAQATLEETIDSIIGRHLALHQQHERDKNETARLEAEQQAERRKAEFKAGLYLNHIEEYLRNEFEFDGGYFEMQQEAIRLQEPIRDALVEELIENPDLDADDIRARIEQLVDDHLD